MSQVTYKSEKLAKKKVYYTGTDTLKAGYNLCYDADATRAAETNTAITAANDAAITSAGVYAERATHVEKPSTTNLSNYAGAVVEEYDNKKGPCSIEVYVPVTRGQKVNVWCEVSTTIDSTLLTLQAGSYALGGIDDGGPVVAKAVQTINRASVNGLVQSLLVGLSHAEAEGEVISLHSRTAAQLPTVAIWKNFNLDLLRRNPFAGTLVEADFKKARDYPAHIFIDTDSHINIGDEAVGSLVLLGSVDEEACEVQYPCPITTSGGKKWAFEVRIKTNTVSANDIGFFFGLMVPSVLVGDLIVDAGASVQTEGSVGIQSFHADTTGVDAVYDATSEAPQVHDADIKTMEVNTYFTIGMYYDGTDIQVFVDGANTGDPILADGDIDAATFPDATVMYPTLATKNGAAEDDTVTIDWLIFAQNA